MFLIFRELFLKYMCHLHYEYNNYIIVIVLNGKCFFLINTDIILSLDTKNINISFKYLIIDSTMSCNHFQESIMKYFFLAIIPLL